MTARIRFCTKENVQASLKVENIGNSDYYYLSSNSDKGVKVGNSKDSTVVYQGMANIPFYMKKNENGRPTAWVQVLAEHTHR